MAEEGTYVGSGSFRISRAKALEKLTLFQLPEEDMALLPWARLACALDASRLLARRAERGLALFIDGRPLLRADLTDPYAGLVGGEEGAGQAPRQLALGMLALWRLGAQEVEICSGPPRERLRLRALSVDGEELASADPKAAWAVEVRAKLYKPAAAGPCLERLARSCPLSRAKIEVVGAAAEVRARPPGALSFEADGRRGWLALPRDPALIRSRIELHQLGVYAASVEHDTPFIAVEGAVTDDALALNASQSGVVEDEARAAALRAFGSRVRVLLEAELASQNERMRRLGPRLAGSPLLQRRWADVSGPELPSAPPTERPSTGTRFFNWLFWKAGLQPDRAADESLLEDVRRTRLLRRVALEQLKGLAKDREDALLYALWSAALYFNPSGQVLSLKSIAQDREEAGFIGVTHAPTSWKAHRTVWLLDKDDRKDLLAFFKGARLQERPLSSFWLRD